MTISSSNLQSVLSVSPDVAAEGLLVGQIQGQAIHTEFREQSYSEGEFWSMLNQQLTDITSQSGSQVIENEELLALLNVFEVELQNAVDKDNESAQWMHILKSHFSNPDTLSETQAVVLPVNPSSMDDGTVGLQPGVSAVESQPAVSTVESQPVVFSVEPQPVVSNFSITDPEGDVVFENGNLLPQVRQVLSTEFGNRPATKGSILNQSKLDASVQTDSTNASESDGESVDFAKQSFDASPHSQSNQQEMVKEKLSLKHSVLEQAGLQVKEATVSTHMLASQPVSLIQQTQSSIQLPSAMQSLHMTAQTPFSELGEALGERVSFIIHNKLSSAEIRIDPPHLGKLDIQIKIKDDSALVVINTQHAQTRDLIDSASVRLRDILQEAGYTSVDVNVSHREQSMEQGEFAQRDDSATEETDANQRLSGAEPSETRQTDMFLSTDSGKIDYFA